MKNLTVILTALAAGSCVTRAQNTWEWTLDSNTPASVLGDGVLDWSTLEALTQATYAVTDGTTVPHIGASPAGYLRFPQYTNQADFARLTFNGSAPNGGGSYLNQYSLVMDVYIPGPHTWLPFFNTNESNTNDADFYVAPDGAVGIGALGYSAPGAVSTDSWHRVIFTADLGTGTVAYYVDGTQVFQTTPGASQVDGRFSIYTAADAGVDLVLGNEGDTSGVYTRDWLLAALAFTDRPLTAAEAAALGAPKAVGIFYNGTVPVPPVLTVTQSTPGNVTLNWTQSGYTLRQSTDLVNWTAITGTNALTTWSEPLAGGRRYFQLTTP